MKKWFAAYKKDGIDALRSKRKGGTGRKRKLATAKDIRRITDFVSGLVVYGAIDTDELKQIIEVEAVLTEYGPISERYLKEILSNAGLLKNIDELKFYSTCFPCNFSEPNTELWPLRIREVPTMDETLRLYRIYLKSKSKSHDQVGLKLEDLMCYKCGEPFKSKDLIFSVFSGKRRLRHNSCAIKAGIVIRTELNQLRQKKKSVRLQ